MTLVDQQTCTIMKISGTERQTIRPRDLSLASDQVDPHSQPSGLHVLILYTPR